MPTLTQLEYALAVEKHRHFGNASAACHVSQPTLSQQLQRLEDEVGIILFDRVQKPIIPTDAGARFLAQAKIVLREHQKLLHLAKATGPDAVAGEFRLGIIPTIGTHLIPHFIHAFAQEYPKVELHVEELKTNSIVEDLKGDRLDGAILATPLPVEGFKVHPLYYEPFYLYASDGHPLLKKTVLTAEDLEAGQMWMLQDGHCFRNQIANFCLLGKSGRRNRILQNVHFESGSLDTLRNLVRKAQGYTLVPALLVEALDPAERKAHVRPFRKPVPAREVSFVYRRDHWKLEIIAALEKTVLRTLPRTIPLKRDAGLEVLDVR